MDSDQINRLKKLWDEGVLAKDIGKELGVSVNVIRKLAMKLPLSPRAIHAQWSEEEINTVRRLWTEGVTSGNISLIVKRSRSAVMGKVHRLGLQRGYLIPRQARPKLDLPKVERPIRKFSPRPRVVIKAPWTPKERVAVEPIPGPQPTEEGVTILELTPFSCKEIVGHKEGYARWCGKIITFGSYCAEHAIKNYRAA